MAIDTVTPRSRRALLAATAGSLAALAAQALGRPLPARAADPNDVVLGGYNTATTTTTILNTANSSTVFYVSSSSGVGVKGYSSSNVGVRGESFATDQPATAGQSSGGSTGLLGYSGTGALPAAPARTGVYGYAAQDSGSRGVWGRSTSGRGVSGQATSGRGVSGSATAGGGVGGYFSGTSGATAFQASGPVRFSTAGSATIAAGSRSSAAVPAGVNLTSGSKVLVTLLGHPGGTTALQRVAVNASADTFTVHLTATATANTKFAWFVIS